MKKVLLCIISIFLLVGCGVGNSPKAKVEKFLMSYQKQDADIMLELDENVAKENYTDTNKKLYKEILAKQYKDLEYKVLEEVIDGDNATVTAEIKVYDLYKVQNAADLYLTEHRTEFNDETGIYDEGKYLTYRLDQMKKAKERVTYTLSFTLTKQNKNWTIDQVDEQMLEKIHGIYNYQT